LRREGVAAGPDLHSRRLAGEAMLQVLCKPFPWGNFATDKPRQSAYKASTRLVQG
jgi:hypothetical protein